MIKPNQITAARALLNWKREDLAKQSDMHHDTIRNIETGVTENPRSNTIKPIIEAFERNGVEFKEGGAVLKQNTLTIIEAPYAFVKLMDTAYHILKEENIKEVLFGFANNRASSEETIQSQNRMRDNLNARFRFLVKDNDTYLRFPISEYRYVPQEFFYPLPYVVFGNYLAIISENNKDISLYNDIGLSEVFKRQFEYMWSIGNKPKETTYV
ncbi:hypothetical protein MHTCC0001_09610 [Flavobacteriaceae bacterium MHTCC 0001]